MSEVWFTSDTHYNHANIVSGVSRWEDKSGCRKFATLKEMNETLIDNINQRVLAQDTLYHLGDWSFGGYDSVELFRSHINCRNIHLCYGNHDHDIEHSPELQKLFESVQHYKEISLSLCNKRKRIVLFHYPILSWNHMNHGAIHLHGHTHGNLKCQGYYDMPVVDVGVDTNSLSPYNADEVVKLIKERVCKQHEQHKSFNHLRHNV